MNSIKIMTITLLLLLAGTAVVHPQGAGIERDTLDQKVIEFDRPSKTVSQVDHVMETITENWWVAVAIVLGIIIIAVGNFLDGMAKIAKFLNRLFTRKPTTAVPLPNPSVTPERMPPTQGAGIEWEIFNQEVKDLYRQGKYDKAVSLAREAIEEAEAKVGTDHPDLANTLNDLALLYKTQGDYAKAEPLYKRSLAILEKVLAACRTSS